MKTLIAAVLLISGVTVWAQGDEEQEFIESCSLSLKVTPLPSVKGERSGCAQVTAFLREKTGAPIPYQVINITATNGIFSCMAPDESSTSVSSDRSCFITGADGRIRVYLVDIPFNSPGRLKAACMHGEFSITATGSYSISKSTKKRRSGKAAVKRSSTH